MCLSSARAVRQEIDEDQNQNEVVVRSTRIAPPLVMGRAQR
jgi:hypothetical protein